MRYPLWEVLFLVTCATVAGCDDYDEIALWGKRHLLFLRSYGEYFSGTPKEDWLRVVLNRIDPALFEACFRSWALSLRPDAADMIALDGKSLRRSGDVAAGLKPLHLVSVWASTQRLVVAQEAVETKANECEGLYAILERLDLAGTLVTIDAIATNPAMAQAITDKGGDDLLSLKRNQPSLHDEVAAHFADPAPRSGEPGPGFSSVTDIDKDHGRIKTRTATVGHVGDWMNGGRRYPGEPRFPTLRTLVKATTTVERSGTISAQTRDFISSTDLTPERAAQAIRSHWGIESLHWVLDVVFKEDLSRLRRGHGAHNMALVRRFAFNIVRAGRAKHSIKTTRKAAGWQTSVSTTSYDQAVNLDSLLCLGRRTDRWLCLSRLRERAGGSAETCRRKWAAVLAHALTRSLQRCPCCQ